MAGLFQPLTGDQVINSKQRMFYDTANPPVTNYYGMAAPGTATSAAGWQIRRETLDAQGRTIQIDFAGSTLEQNQVWNNYATLTYG